MNKWKVWAILFTLFSAGALRETVRICTSNDQDIAQNRSFLIPMALVLTGVVLFFTIRFWRKAGDKHIY